MLDDAVYEGGDVETRLLNRLRLADELVLVARIENQSGILIGDRDADQTINIASDERFIRSLDRLGLVSLEPTLRAHD
ncbi:MAG TPA: hypothetical protein VKF16_02360 [Candidatus Dormibacteraeota bacterium]|nr:hypothetical protein [Candidatus Dormibacteraeota bacterium]